MKKALLIGLVLLFGATQAFGQAGTIAVFNDVNATSCNLVYPGIATFYAFHLFHGGATASQWKLQQNAGSNMTWFADQLPTGMVAVGKSTTGIAIGYGGCKPAPTLICNIVFFGGSANPCSSVSIVPDPIAASGKIEGVDCNEKKTFPTGQTSFLNNNSNCPCSIVPADDTSWGQIKALYN